MKNLPSDIDKVKSLIQSGFDISLDFFKNRKLIADSELSEKRLSICMDCDYFCKDSHGKFRCCECGCYLLTKLHFHGTRCRLKKW